MDPLWKLGFDELDARLEQLNERDERFLDAVRGYVEKVKQNQENVVTIAVQFGMELKEWEKAAREELHLTTTSLQPFLPVKSFEEMNQVVNDIQNKTAHLLLTPAQAITTGQFQALDKYLETVGKYIAIRKNGREKYMDSVKKTSNVLYQNQKVLVNLFAKQMKTLFPLQKFINSGTKE